jgi:hypothetical protein
MPSRRCEVRIPALVVACAVSLGAAGCAQNRIHATAPVAAAPEALAPQSVRPMTIAPDTDATPPVETDALPPVMPPASAPPTQVLLEPANPPAPPRRPETRSAGADAQGSAGRPAPQISPQISPTDQSLYARRTSDDMAAAEHNLQQTSGKHLSAAQQDLADKIRSFIAQSRDASKAGDWDRAQNLAQKARLLSTELLNSL